MKWYTATRLVDIMMLFCWVWDRQNSHCEQHCLLKSTFTTAQFFPYM